MGYERPVPQSTETFYAFGIPRDCTKCSLARDRSKAIKKVILELAEYDDRSEYYGNTPGKPAVVITQTKIDIETMTNPNFVELIDEYETLHRLDKSARAVCHETPATFNRENNASTDIICGLDQEILG